MADNLTKKQRSYNMSRIRAKNTGLELNVFKILKDAGIKFHKHYSKLPGKPDIVINDTKTVIFVNGCFWHKHKECNKYKQPKSNVDYWIKKIDKNVTKQKNDIKELKQLGWKTIIVWECQTDLQAIINLLKLNKLL